LYVYCRMGCDNPVNKSNRLCIARLEFDPRKLDYSRHYFRDILELYFNQFPSNYLINSIRYKLIPLLALTLKPDSHQNNI
jgi:hypothetical protein